MALLMGGCVSDAPIPSPVFDAWYAQTPVGNAGSAPGLWPLLASRANFPVLDAPGTAGLVHLQIEADQQLTVQLQRDGGCVGQLSIAGTLDGQRYQFSDSDFNGIPVLAWGHNNRQVSLDLSSPQALAATVHTSSFGMFLIIAGGAPDRDVTYRYNAVAQPAVRGLRCPAPTPGR
ncbi:hypothetical protein [Pseudomonas sp. TE3786]